MPQAFLSALVPSLVDTRAEYNRVFDYYVPIAIAVLVIIFVAAIFLLIKNRRRSHDRVSQTHENNPLEGGYAIFLTCLVAFLLWVTFTAEHRTDTVANRVRPYMTVNVIASKWEWTFYYPTYHVTVRSGTTGMGTFVVPVGKPIRFTLTSQDVIHGFWIPELRWKHDLIYGKTQYQTLTFSRSGIFQGQCTVFCGLRHSNMVFQARAVSPSRFLAWARSGGKAPV